MLNKKTIKNILLEVEASCYNYEKYLNELIKLILDKEDIKYLIARENDYLILYKYSEDEYIQWLYDKYDVYDEDDVYDNYSLLCEYANQNYIEYYVEENILNFINISKFRNMLYNNEKILNIILNNIYGNIRNYANNKYLVYEYNLNKKLYHELKKIQK